MGRYFFPILRVERCFFFTLKTGRQLELLYLFAIFDETNIVISENFKYFSKERE